MNKFFLILMIFLLNRGNFVFSQDHVFSQPYMSQVYLNPAATGSGDYDLRISGIVRRQWHTIPSSFTYSAFSIDKFLPSLQSGIGLLVTSASEGYLKKNGVYASYAYTFCPGVPRAAENGGLPKWFLTGAVQFGFAQRRVDYKDLLFSDQIGVDGIIPGAETEADLAINSGRWYPDVSSGLFFNYRTGNADDGNDKKLLIGISAKHINRPDESYTATNSKARSIVPVLWSVNLLYSAHLGNDWTYSFIGNGSKQQNNKLVQLGFEVTQNVIDLGLGIWYRGFGIKNADAVGLSLSFNLSGRNNQSSKIRVGIAHDASVGHKKYSYNGGSSELAFVWDKKTYSTEGDNPCKPVVSAKSVCPTVQ